MVRIFQVVVFSCIGLVVIGCGAARKNRPVWEQVKIGDIAPSAGSEQAGPRFLKTISFDVHIFEIPAENINKLDDIWQILYAQPLRFRDYKAFWANSFFVRFGQAPMWGQVLDLLHAAGGQKVVTVKLLLADGQASDVIVTRLNSKQDVLYVSRSGLTDKASVGPGLLCLRVKTDKIAGLRGVCNLVAEPVFSLPTGSPIPDLVEQAQKHEFAFAPLAFGLKISPGDFVLLGPEKYISDRKALAGLLFSEPKGSLFFDGTGVKRAELKPAVRVFILVCAGIVD
jgi:hypothetical protein